MIPNTDFNDFFVLQPNPSQFSSTCHLFCDFLNSLAVSYFRSHTLILGPPFIYVSFLRSLSPPHINPAFVFLSSPCLFFSGTSRHVFVLPSRGSNSYGSGDARPGKIPGQSRGRNTGIIITIIVIISQLRRVKLELCPSPSGSLTVTKSSLIHSTHQLYTGQRSPERQEAAKAPLHVSTRLQHEHTLQCSMFSANHQCPPLVSLRAGGSLSSCL